MNIKVNLIIFFVKNNLDSLNNPEFLVEKFADDNLSFPLVVLNRTDKKIIEIFEDLSQKYFGCELKWITRINFRAITEDFLDGKKVINLVYSGFILNDNVPLNEGAKWVNLYSLISGENKEKLYPLHLELLEEVGQII